MTREQAALDNEGTWASPRLHTRLVSQRHQQENLDGSTKACVHENATQGLNKVVRTPCTGTACMHVRTTGVPPTCPFWKLNSGMQRRYSRQACAGSRSARRSSTASHVATSSVE